MLRTGNAGVRPREMALPEKRRGGVPAGRFESWGFCRFPLPCFGSECHTFGLKIATAALRPRNDTKLGRLYLENGRFSFMQSFLRGVAPHRFQTFRSENRFVRKAARRMQLPGKRSRTK